MKSDLRIKSLVLRHEVEGWKGGLWLILSAELQWQEYQCKGTGNEQK